MRIITFIAGPTESIALENRVFNTTTFLASVVMLVATIANEAFDFPFAFDMLLLASSGLFGVAFYRSRFKQRYRFAKGTLLVMSIVLAPIVWHFNQGMTGSSTFYFFAFILLVIAGQRRYKYGIAVAFVGYVVLLALLQRQIPWFVVPFPSPEVAFWDFFFSFIVTGTIFLVGAIALRESYEAEQQRVEKQKAELLSQRDQLIALNQEQQAHNNTILQQKSELEHLNGINNKLFSIISHDLRSPLANLQTMIQVIAFSDPSIDESRQLMAGIERELHNSSALLENLLKWAQKQKQGIQFSQTEFVLESVVDENLRLIATRAHDKQIDLRSQLDKNLAVRADKDMVRLVLRNLLSNALKFSRKGDSIVVRAIPKSDYVLVSVRDTGIGISPEHQARLFKSTDFTRRGTDNEKGSGLGLFLCHDFVEKNGGRIWCESEEGQGATFFFTLALATDHLAFSPAD